MQVVAVVTLVQDQVAVVTQTVNQELLTEVVVVQDHMSNQVVLAVKV
jgi:hypothetical protein